jgi:signal transduction histidine kinase
MQSLLHRIRLFWNEEEIPRRIGLLLVGVFVVAPGALLILSQRQTAIAISGNAEQSYGRSVAFLAEQLGPSKPRIDRKTLATMNRFAQMQRCLGVRILDKTHTVLASTLPTEVGFPVLGLETAPRSVPQDIETLIREKPGKDGERLVVRAPIESPGDIGLRYVEVRFGRDALASSTASIQMLIVALLCAGAFLLLYGSLRKHFGSVKQIALQLEQVTTGGDVQLASLRLVQTPDALAEGWNRLIDRAAEHEEELSRSMASSELLAALDRTNAGDLAEAMRLVPTGVLLVSESMTVIYANAMSCRVMGWTVHDESTWQLGADIEMTDDAVLIADQIRAAGERGEAQGSSDSQIELSDGSFYSLRVSPMQTAQHSRRMIAMIQDVSQQVRADKAREEFVSQVTHELRTPLTNIRAYAETLSSGMFDDPQVITECYNVITKETRRLSRLIEDILSISQLEVGTMQLVMDRVDLCQLLTESVRDVRGIAESKNIDLQLSLPPKAERISGDRDKLAVVVNNLLGNALKYTPENGQVVLSCRSENDALTVSVRDSGIGIAPRDHGRIFEKFQRAEDPDVLSETGTGIGLTTAQEIVRQHGGEIRVVSKKGEGATFSFTLALDKSPSALQGSGSKQ